nr:cytochrome b [Craspedonirmus immer]
MKLNKKVTLQILKASAVPTPSSLSYFWNFGSLLGVSLGVQIVSGLFLAMNYEASVDLAFDSVEMMMTDATGGWTVRHCHANGASMFFIFLYLHLGRGIYYGSFGLTMTWAVGMVIILVSMGTAFLGYVLPWGQMSYWGATVITNLVSVIPYFGVEIVQWLWGGFSVSNPTLIRFFSIHFILPFVILGMVVVHILALHSSGSTNPLGVSFQSDKVFFTPYFLVKDLLGVVLALLFLLSVVLVSPQMFMDPDNFIKANPMNTPPHIQPEWYFLFAYAILRSVPNKLGGVVALVSSIVILVLFPLSGGVIKSVRFQPVMKMWFWFLVCDFLLLTWLGMMPVETPFVEVSQVSSFLYFFIYAVYGPINKAFL